MLAAVVGAEWDADAGPAWARHESLYQFAMWAKGQGVIAARYISTHRK